MSASRPGTRSPALAAAALACAATALAPPASAACDPAVEAIAELQVRTAPLDADPARAAETLERALGVCERQDWWLALGGARAAQGRDGEAERAYLAARDFHAPDADGLLPADQLRAQVEADTGLARVRFAGGDAAGALAAIEDARRTLALLGESPAPALMTLQAEVDDAMSRADAATLTRSLRSQRTARTRAVGVRPRADAAAAASPPTGPVPAGSSSEPLASADGADGPGDGTAGAAGAPSRPATEATPGTSAATAVAAPPAARINLQVLFDFDSDRIAAGSDALVRAMADAVGALELGPSQRVWVVGHTDVTGPAAYNETLARRRAEAVRARLAARLGPDVPIAAIGRGERDPRYPGTRAEDHRRNRRVELVVSRDAPEGVR